MSAVPPDFCPTEDQGYAILLARLPDGTAQPRSRELSKKIGDIIRRTPGISGWVTIGGFSVLDGANVVNAATTFVVYKDWSQRGSALSQEKIVAGLNRELSQIQEAQASW